MIYRISVVEQLTEYNQKVVKELNELISQNKVKKAELAKKNHALAIVNGESVGQVASQTLTSMNVINSVTNIPVIRPVACFDKLEIIEY